MVEPGVARSKVVLAIDGSPSSCRSFEYYLDELHQPNDDIILLHCPQLPRFHYKSMKEQYTPDEDWILIWDEVLKQWTSLKQTFQQELNNRKLTAKFEVEPTNDPGPEIVQYLAESKATYVVTGTRSLSAIKRTLLGSVSTYILHNAHCPVVVYKDIELVLARVRSKSASSVSRERAGSGSLTHSGSYKGRSVSVTDETATAKELAQSGSYTERSVSVPDGTSTAIKEVAQSGETLDDTVNPLSGSITTRL